MDILGKIHGFPLWLDGPDTPRERCEVFARMLRERGVPGVRIIEGSIATSNRPNAKRQPYTWLEVEDGADSYVIDAHQSFTYERRNFYDWKHARPAEESPRGDFDDVGGFGFGFPVAAPQRLLSTGLPATWHPLSPAAQRCSGPASSRPGNAGTPVRIGPVAPRRRDSRLNSAALWQSDDAGMPGRMEVGTRRRCAAVLPRRRAVEGLEMARDAAISGRVTPFISSAQSAPRRFSSVSVARILRTRQTQMDVPVS